MGKKLELIGKKFGKLLVLEEAESKRFKKSVVSMWKCICDCGKITITYGSELNKGKVLSCGCYHRESVRKESGAGGLSDLFSGYKRNAKKRQLEFSLTKDQFKLITSQNCYYCNKPPLQKNYTHYERSAEAIEHETYIYNGIDRIDSSIGYILDNCIPCCGLHNFMKSNYSQKEFLEAISSVYEFRINLNREVAGVQ